MPRRSATIALTIVGLVLLPAPAQLGQPGEAPAERPRIEVSVDCDASPERVSITNNASRPLKLESVGSTYQRRAGEPYRVKRTLRSGTSVSYTFGTGTGKGKRLTGSFIFDNDEASEGVRIKTTRGNVKVRCSAGTNVPPTPEEPVAVALTPGSPTDPAAPVEAATLLASLPVLPEQGEGYDRARFEHWIDADSDGCDTRQEVLIAESLDPPTVGPGCMVEDGAWLSMPDGDTLTNPASMDVNHVLPLREAWASGAHAWTDERRRAFANDLDDGRTLQAVSAGANRLQGDRDPASWLPADLEAACRFITDWIAIKASWGLAVDETERDAIALTLDSCGERLITETAREP